MLVIESPKDLARRILVALRNPSRLLDILKSETYYQMHPNLPSITKDACETLERMSMENWRVFEWGSGRSTMYFAKRAKSLVSVEHDIYWLNKVSKSLKSRGLTNVEMVHVHLREPEIECGYHDVILRFPDEYFDCIMIDANICRDQIIANCPQKLKSGGIVVMDNTESKHDDKPFRNWPSVITTNGVWKTTIWTKP